MAGQSTTLLPDGSALTVGGTALSGVVSRALRSGAGIASLRHASAWHTATVLTVGCVLVFGGVDARGLVAQAEFVSPNSITFSAAAEFNVKLRAYHTATLLTDGRLLIAGGVSSDGKPLDRIELWDPKNRTSQILSAHLSQARRSHKAALQQDGTVLVGGGVLADGSPASRIEVFSPDTLSMTGLGSAPSAATDHLRHTH